LPISWLGFKPATWTKRGPPLASPAPPLEGDAPLRIKARRELPGAGPSSTRGSAEPVPLLVLKSLGAQSQYNNSIVVIINRRETGLIVSLLSDGNFKSRSGDTVDRQLANEMAVVGEFHNFAGQLGRNGRIDCVAITGEKVPVRC
jgi:hypothetical protein